MLQDKLNGKEGKFYNRLCTYNYTCVVYLKKSKNKNSFFFIKMKKLTIEKKLLLHDVQVRRLNLKRFRKLVLVFLLLKIVCFLEQIMSAHKYQNKFLNQVEAIMHIY